MITDDTEDETRRLRALRALQLLGTPAEERFDRVTALCARLFGTQGAAITLIDRDRQWAKSLAGGEPGSIDVPREHSFCNVALGYEEGLVVEDASADPRFVDNPLVAGDPNLRFYAGHRLQAPGGHPVGALCIFGDEPRTLTDEDRALLRDLALWVEKEMAVEDELERAAEVQRGLQPSTPPGMGAWDIAGRCAPSREVGGDLYDWYSEPRGVAVTVADVMGKGMSAAIMMATLRAVLRAGTRTGDLTSAVAAAAQTMEDDFAGTGAFATVFHAELDPDSGLLTYVDAGHGLALLRRADGRLQRTESGGLPAGPFGDRRWRTASVELRVGGQLCIFSDGLLDLYPDIESAFAAVGDALTEGADAGDIVDRLLEPAERTRPPDDVTVVVLRRIA
jgi:hypothetical protein